MHVPRPDDTTLDPWHAAVVDDVCTEDAARVAAGEQQFVRFAIDHELCLPGACGPLPAGTLIVVTAHGDGIRSRIPLTLGAVAA